MTTWKSEFIIIIIIIIITSWQITLSCNNGVNGDNITCVVELEWMKAKLTCVIES